MNHDQASCEAYQRYLMREMVFSASKTCAEELQHVLEQVVLGLADFNRVYACFSHVSSMFYDVSCMSDPSLLLSPFPMHKVAAGLGKKSSGKTGFPLGVSLLHFRIWLVLIIDIVAAVNRIRSKGERCCKMGCCNQ